MCVTGTKRPTPLALSLGADVLQPVKVEHGGRRHYESHEIHVVRKVGKVESPSFVTDDSSMGSTNRGTTGYCTESSTGKNNSTTESHVDNTGADVQDKLDAWAEIDNETPVHLRKKRRRKPQQPGKTAKMKERHFVQHNYHDYANDPCEDEPDLFVEGTKSSSSSPSEEDKKKNPFPIKLHEVLESVEKDGFATVISWQSHGRAFVIHKPKAFANIVMPRYFRQTKLTSFQRQLNLYGFVRISRGRDTGGYYNELFLRGRPRLCLKMVRVKVKGTGYKAASNPTAEPNFYAMPPVMPLAPKQHPTSPECVIPLPSPPAYPASLPSSNPDRYHSQPVYPSLVPDHAPTQTISLQHSNHSGQYIDPFLPAPVPPNLPHSLQRQATSFDEIALRCLIQRQNNNHLHHHVHYHSHPPRFNEEDNDVLFQELEEFVQAPDENRPNHVDDDIDLGVLLDMVTDNI